MEDKKDYQNIWLGSQKAKECECGCHKTYGKSCPLDYHSDWCNLSPNYKELSEDTYPNLGDYYD